MNKLLLAIMLLASTSLFARTNLQLHYDLGKDRNHFTSTIERFKPDAHGSLFYFVDFNYNADGPTEAYFEIARQIKFWDGPFAAQIEYNGGLHADANMSFQINNAYLGGAAYNWNNNDYSRGFTLSALYKNIQGNVEPHNFQLTGVWYMHMLNRKLTFMGFADFWREKTFFGSTYTFLSEPQIWYNIHSKVSVGGEVEIANNFAGVEGWMVRPTVALKFNL